MDIRLPDRLERAPSAVRNLSDKLRHGNRWLPVVLAAGGIVVLALLAWHFLAPGEQPAPSAGPPVTVARAQSRNVTAIEHTIGTVVAVSTVQVTAQVGGQLMSAPFKEGQLVHVGDLLFQIDPRPYQAALARDRANAISAAHDKQRFLALAAQGAASGQQRDQAVATADADAAIVKADQLNLDYTTIRSPITGKTGPILVQPGNLIAANNTAAPLVVITQIQPIKVSVSLPQTELPRLMAQMRAKKLEAIVNLRDGAPFAAPIDFIGNQVDARTGTIELRATFANADYRLVPGQLVDTGVTMNQYANATVVPHDAVNLGPNSKYVYVVGKDAVAHMREVNVLYDDGASAAMAGDVKPGDRVIVEGQLRVQPDTAVTIARRIGP